MKVKVWNGKRMVTVNGLLVKFPFKVDDRPQIQLFTNNRKRGRKWWLYYGDNNLTGDFPTKKAAVAWIEKGGR